MPHAQTQSSGGAKGRRDEDTANASYEITDAQTKRTATELERSIGKLLGGYNN